MDDILENDPVLATETQYADGADDVLGLDKPIKLTTRAKIAKIDNQRIFNNQTGLNFITKNHQKVVRTIRKNDSQFQKRSAAQKSKHAKYDHEYNNLTTILQFYQLWCHQLFPKARFKDCAHLIRALGSKSPQLRLYRRELIDLELNKLKIAKGIIDDQPVVEQEEAPAREEQTDQPPQENNDDEDEDDWSFMNVRRRPNGLFVGDDDDEDEDLYQAPIGTNLPDPVSQPAEIGSTPATIDSVGIEEHTALPQPEDDPFSDDDESILAGIEATVEDTGYDDENDLELMREFE